MTFAFPAIFWFGLPLVALPAIIHLLNLRRQQRVPWGAMKFLLESQQRSKTWINLKELLLLLLRTAAVALLVLMLARPSLRSGWLNQWIGEPTHHIVLVDDSYSSNDRFGDTSAWQQTRGALQSIVKRVSEESQANRLTILRFTEAQGASEVIEPPITRLTLNPEAREDLLGKIEGWQATASDASLVDALADAEKLIGQWSDDKLVLHVAGDLRRRDLQPEDDLFEQLTRIRDKVEHLHLVGAARSQSSNLAIRDLSIAGGNLAAGVEVWAEIAVTNYSTETARGVVAEVEQDSQPLSAVDLGDIPPGDTVRQRFRCRFAEAGSHSLVATIDEDAVATDNTRYLAVEVPQQLRVLLIDGSPSSIESYYLSGGLAPGGGTQTGWASEVITPAELEGTEKLEEFAVIALLDVPKLKAESLKRIEDYVAAGGGLFVSLGESIDRDWYRSDFFREGTGSLPVPPTLPTQWVPPEESSETDVQVADHPATSIFSSANNSFLPLLQIEYYYAVKSNWQSVPESLKGKVEPKRVIAKLSTGAPLVVEQNFGEGRVMVQLMPVSSKPGALGVWSNWALNIGFSPFAMESFAWLSEGKRPRNELTVGEAITHKLDAKEFDGTGRLAGTSDGLAFDAGIAPQETDDKEEKDKDFVDVAWPELTEPGLYELSLTRLVGADQKQLWSVNPNATEGDLALPPASMLNQKLANAKFSFEWADSLISQSDVSTGTSLVESLFIVLILVLACEQVLAYLCSYHD